MFELMGTFAPCLPAGRAKKSLHGEGGYLRKEKRAIRLAFSGEDLSNKGREKGI